VATGKISKTIPIVSKDSSRPMFLSPQSGPRRHSCRGNPSLGPFFIWCACFANLPPKARETDGLLRLNYVRNRYKVPWNWWLGSCDSCNSWSGDFCGSPANARAEWADKLAAMSIEKPALLKDPPRAMLKRRSGSGFSTRRPRHPQPAARPLLLGQ
jgi:hypothetical protein